MTVLGFRAYANSVPPTGGRGVPWHQPRMRAACPHGHEAPCPTEGPHGSRAPCGIYGVYDPAEALCYGTVLALARASGVVYLHEGGWRAQEAQVLAVVVDDETWALWRKHCPAWVEVERIDPRDFWLAASLLQRLRRALRGEPLSLQYADFRGVDVRRADLECADMRHADFEGATLRGANFVRAALIGANFTRADLCGADFEGAHLWSARLSRADFRGANFARAQLSRAVAQHADFEGASFFRASLVELNLRRSLLDRACVHAAFANDLDAQFLRAERSDWTHGYLVRANFADAQLREASFRHACAAFATFRAANLRGADFRGAKLEHADFRGADLRDADFRGASLDGADFRLARLVGACFDGASLDGARFDERRVRPGIAALGETQ